MRLADIVDLLDFYYALSEELDESLVNLRVIEDRYVTSFDICNEGRRGRVHVFVVKIGRREKVLEVPVLVVERPGKEEVLIIIGYRGRRCFRR